MFCKHKNKKKIVFRKVFLSLNIEGASKSQEVQEEKIQLRYSTSSFRLILLQEK